MVDVHGCGHIMRILQGVNKETKLYILCAQYAHEKRLKMTENGVKLVRLDKMSRREERKDDRKTDFIREIEKVL